MRICCNRCGKDKIIFTTKGDQFGQHHGARCATCNKPISLKDLFFKSSRLKSDEVTALSVPLPPKT